jgi:TPP-dependent pyruvate/acetoin dehydrogenase alpha subunit
VAGRAASDRGAQPPGWPSEQLSNEELLTLYRELNLIRRFNDKQIEIFGAGIMPGSLHPGLGHEAIALGVIHGVRRTDYINGTHRTNNAMMVLRGVPLRQLWAECLGRDTGINRGRRGVDLMGSFDDSVRVFPQNPVLGHNAGIATGVALALQLDKREEVMLVLMGEGASVAGTVWEACFFAGVRKLPIVYCVENNLVAYSTPFEAMTPTETVSERAAAFGFPGQLVDGNDPLAVMDAVHSAAARARAGKGPTLLELRTYRFVGHFIGDPEVYRTREDVRRARQQDPLVLFANALRKRRLLDDELIARMTAEHDAVLKESLDQALNDPFPNPDNCLPLTYQSGVYPMGYSS